MYRYCVHTLVDISDPGDTRLTFPFRSKSGELVDDKQTLELVKNQFANFTTMKQLLQMRSNISWENAPMRDNIYTSQFGFGSFYNEGKHNIWTFFWEVEQQGVYSVDDNPIGGLRDDFNLIPINSFCRETVTFPANVFNTKDSKFKNTVFSDMGPTDK